MKPQGAVNATAARVDAVLPATNAETSPALIEAKQRLATDRTLQSDATLDDPLRP